MSKTQTTIGEQTMMNKLTTKLNSLILTAWVTVFSSPLFAKLTDGLPDDIINQGGKERLKAAAGVGFDWLFYIVGIVAVWGIITGGLMLADGKEEGKNRIKLAVIGFVIALVGVGFITALDATK